MLIINGPTIHEKCFSVQSKIAKVKETRELVSSSSPWLLGRGMENKLVMSVVGYVASFSGSFHAGMSSLRFCVSHLQLYVYENDKIFGIK